MPIAAPIPPVTTNAPVQPKPVAEQDSGDSMAPNILAWDTVSEEYRAKPGEMIAPFSFSLTNVSSEPVTIYDASTSCDCTVASLPAKPWIVPPGGSGKISATVDMHDRTGEVTNSIVVFTSQGNRRLHVKAIVPGS